MLNTRGRWGRSQRDDRTARLGRSLQVLLYDNGKAVLTEGCRFWLKPNRLRVVVQGSLTLSRIGQGSVKPYFR